MKTALTLFLSIPMLCHTSHAGLFPNGDFENGATSWEQTSGGGTFAFDFPASGGNPDGYGVIDNSAGDGGFGILVTDNGAVLTLESLGLVPGETYRFTQDMIRLSGPNMGGFKVDFFTGGVATPGRATTGDIFPAPINAGDTWETYEFLVNIPADADGLKAVALWGAGSTVGYDNLQVDTAPLVGSPIQNSDFSQGSFGWAQIGAGTTWTYPAEGGNPGAYGVMTNAGGGFGIWIANGDQIIPLSDLDLEAGTTVLFQQDMIILSGTSVGGLKIDFFSGDAFVGSTGDIDPPVIGDGSTWESYTFPILIPAQSGGLPVDGIKIVPLEGQGSSVGYDNIRVVVPPAPFEAPLSGRLSEGTIVSWSPTNPEKIYQPQRSEDGNNFTSFGPAYPGTDTTSLLDPNPAAFYRILETDLPGENILINGSFERPGLLDPDCAESWQCLSPSGQFPVRIVSDSFSGQAAMRIAVQNDDSAAPNQAEIQQNLEAAGAFVTPGETYTLSFRAKQISSGVSYVQRYQLQWFGFDGPLGENLIPFTDFSGGNDSWEETVSVPVVAPDDAVGALIQIFGSTGAVAGTDARGEVLIDAVALTPGAAGGSQEVLETTETPGIGIYAQTREGQLYQAQVTTDFRDFDNLSGIFAGNGEPVGAGTVREGDKRFYLLRELSEDGQ